jgi:hypothetical protein
MDSLLASSISGTVTLYQGDPTEGQFFADRPDEGLERVTATAYLGLFHVPRFAQFNTREATKLQDGIISVQNMVKSVGYAMGNSQYTSTYFSTFDANLRQHDDFATAAVCATMKNWFTTTGQPFIERILQLIFFNEYHVVAVGAGETRKHAALAFEGILDNLPGATVCPNIEYQTQEHAGEFAKAYLIAVDMHSRKASSGFYRP